MSVEITVGDVREKLKEMPAESVDCVVTSPPYWGLRDYGTTQWAGGDPSHEHDRILSQNGRGGSSAGGKQTEGAFPRDVAAPECSCGAVRVDRQIGLEQTPEAYVAELVAVFREVWRVLKPTGTLWLNLGDSYATGAGKVGDHPGGGERGRKWAGSTPERGEKHRSLRDGSHAGEHTAIAARGPMTQPNRLPLPGLKPKDLIGVPWRVAFALQADGWWLRQDIVWAKPNPMPESVLDRCTKSHEYIFLFSKSGEPTIWRAKDTSEWSLKPDLSQKIPNPSTDPEQAKRKPFVNRWRGFDYYYDADAIVEPCTQDEFRPSFRGGSYVNNSTFDNSEGGKATVVGNVRRVGIGHNERDRKGVPNGAGRAAGNDVAYPTRNKRSVWTVGTEPFPEAHFATFPSALIEPCVLAGCPPGGLVLDPFGGAGTTGVVADRLQRNAVLIELNPDYAEMSRRRILKDGGMLVDVQVRAA